MRKYKEVNQWQSSKMESKGQRKRLRRHRMQILLRLSSWCHFLCLGAADSHRIDVLRLSVCPSRPFLVNVISQGHLERTSLDFATNIHLDSRRTQSGSL